MLTKAIIKDIQSLQHKKFRIALNAFPAEGAKLVEELLISGAYFCQRLIATQSWSGWEMAQSHISEQTEVLVVEPFEMEKLTSLSSPPQVIAIFSLREMKFDFSTKGELTLMLDDIQDPGNLGTIIRTADWFGIKNIVCSMHTVDVYNPKVVQSTMASMARVNVIYTDLSSWLDDHKGLPVFASAMDGEELSAVNHVSEGILVIGNEGKGISESVMGKANKKITISRIGDAESLNAAVATSIMLYHFKNIN